MFITHSTEYQEAYSDWMPESSSRTYWANCCLSSSSVSGSWDARDDDCDSKGCARESERCESGRSGAGAGAEAEACEGSALPGNDGRTGCQSRDLVPMNSTLMGGDLLADILSEALTRVGFVHKSKNLNSGEYWRPAMAMAWQPRDPADSRGGIGRKK